MKKIEFPIKDDYISIRDASNLQKLISNMFDNFDGGFGGALDTDLYEMHQPIDDRNISFGFTTFKPNSRDIATFTWPPNGLSFEDYSPYKKSIRFSMFEVLFEVCKVLNVEFSPTKSCINNCILKYNEREK